LLDSDPESGSKRPDTEPGSDCGPKIGKRLRDLWYDSILNDAYRNEILDFFKIRASYKII